MNALAKMDLATQITVVGAVMAVIVGAIAILVSWIIGRQQMTVARKQLALDLISRRLDWRAKLSGAVGRRQAESYHSVANRVVENENGSIFVLPMEHEEEIARLERDAVWLFDSEMVKMVGEVKKAVVELNRHDLADHQAGRVMGEHMGAFIKLAASEVFLDSYLASWIYVGDIGRPKKNAKMLRINPDP